MSEKTIAIAKISYKQGSPTTLTSDIEVAKKLQDNIRKQLESPNVGEFLNFSPVYIAVDIIASVFFPEIEN